MSEQVKDGVDEEHEEKREPDSRWTTLPDGVMLSVFGYLSASSLFQASLVCKSWLRLAFDEILWKNLFYRHWGVDRSIPMAPGKQSWVQEYRRLLYHTPSVESEVLKEHTDEVLHVSFSNNGEMFATASKDAFIMVWTTSFPSKLIYKANMNLCLWSYTVFSRFNQSDTYLLVSSGPKVYPDSSGNREIAIFALEAGFQLERLVPCRPYDLAGGWLNDCFFLSGNNQTNQNGSYSLLYANQVKRDGATASGNENIKLLKFRNNFDFAVRSAIVVDSINDSKDTEENKASDETTKSETGRTDQSDRNTFETCQSVKNWNLSCSTGNIKNEIKSVRNQTEDSNSVGTKAYDDACSAFTKLTIDESDEQIKEYDSNDFKTLQHKTQPTLETCATTFRISGQNKTEHRLENAYSSEFTRKRNEDVQSSFRKCTDEEESASDGTASDVKDTLSLPQNLSIQNLFLQLKDKYLVFRTERRASIPHQIGIKKLMVSGNTNECGYQGSNSAEEIHDQIVNENDCDTIDHLIEMHGHVLGIALSPDQRYLYVNCRCWPENYEIKDPRDPPELAKDVSIFVVDLLTMKKTKTVHCGHMGYTNGNQCFLLDLDVSDEYVASGSEDCQGYLWDRHYGVCIRKYPHDDVVSSAAFNPRDSELLVTVSDDHSIKIWRSLNRQREVLRVQC